MYQEVMSVLRQICENGYLAYIVGGYARNRYLNIISKDVDICTNASLEVLSSLFPEGQIVSIQYGSMRLLSHDLKFEITMFRKEFGSLDSRYPKGVLFVDDLYITS